MARGTISFASAKIGFRNFAGQEGPFNKAGDRNFVIFMDTERAQELEAEGWNIKWPKPNANIVPEEDERNPYIPVSASYNLYPPKIVLITGDTMNVLQEDELSMLDWAEIEKADAVLRPYHWSVNGKSGIKAYVEALYITISTDVFFDQYGI